MGGGIGGGKSSSSGSNYEGLTKEAKPLANQLIGSYQGFLGSGGLDDATKLFQSTIRGDNLDPSKNAALQKYLGQMQDQFGETTGKAFRDARSYTGLKGVDTGSAGAQILGDSARGASDDFGRTLSQALMGDYAQQQQYQMNAPQALMQFLGGSFAPLSTLREGTGSNQASAWNANANFSI